MTPTFHDEIKILVTFTGNIKVRPLSSLTSAVNAGEVSGHLHALTFLLLEKKPKVLTDGGLMLDCTFWRIKSSPQNLRMPPRKAQPKENTKYVNTTRGIWSLLSPDQNPCDFRELRSSGLTRSE